MRKASGSFRTRPGPPAIVLAAAALSFGPAPALAQSSGWFVPADATVSAATVAAIPGVALATGSLSWSAVLRGSINPESATRIWGSGFGSWSRVGSDARGPALTSSGSGFGVGIDRMLHPSFLGGIALSYSETETSSIASGSRVENLSGAVYGVWNPWAGFELSGLAGGGTSDIEATRILTIGGIGTRLRGDSGGMGLNLAAAAGYKFTISSTAGALFLKPFAAVTYSDLRRDEYVETGAGGVALLFPAQTFERATATLGVAAGADVTFGHGWTVRPELRLGWSRYLVDPTPPVVALFGGAPVVIRDPDPGRDAVVVGLDVTAWQSGYAQIFAGYVGEFRANAQSHLQRGGLRVSW